MNCCWENESDGKHVWCFPLQDPYLRAVAIASADIRRGHQGIEILLRGLRRQGHPQAASLYRELLWADAHKEIAGHLETEPTCGHAGCDFQQVGRNALVQALHAFLGNDLGQGVGDRLVFVSHSRHGVDLKASSENITVIHSSVYWPNCWSCTTIEENGALTKGMCTSAPQRPRWRPPEACASHWDSCRRRGSKSRADARIP